MEGAQGERDRQRPGARVGEEQLGQLGTGMKLRYYEDISYRTRGGKFVRVTPGDGKPLDAASPYNGKWVRTAADSAPRAQAGGSAGTKVVK